MYMKEFYLRSFLNKFNDSIDSSLLESLQKGYNCIFEGYGDVVAEEHEDALSTFNYNATYNNGFGVNPVMAFLNNSSNEINKIYSVDEEPELDNIPTHGNEIIQTMDTSVSNDSSMPTDFDDDIHERLDLTVAELNNLI